eukprot:6373383-Lingulodinium_polyedra.AAC.1
MPLRRPRHICIARVLPICFLARCPDCAGVRLRARAHPAACFHWHCESPGRIGVVIPAQQGI